MSEVKRGRPNLGLHNAVTFTVTDAMLSHLKAAAAAEKTTVSELIRSAVAKKVGVNA